jgi:hypothetical protein
MRTDLYPLQVLLVALAGWVNHHQQHIIEYLIQENRVLKDQLRGAAPGWPMTSADASRPRGAALVAGS